jgi:hypothetical protein
MSADIARQMLDTPAAPARHEPALQGCVDLCMFGAPEELGPLLHALLFGDVVESERAAAKLRGAVEERRA